MSISEDDIEEDHALGQEGDNSEFNDSGEDPAYVTGSEEYASQLDGLGSENRDTDYEGGPFSKGSEPDDSLTDLGRAIKGDGDGISSPDVDYR